MGSLIFQACIYNTYVFIHIIYIYNYRNNTNTNANTNNGNNNDSRNNNNNNNNNNKYACKFTYVYICVCVSVCVLCISPSHTPSDVPPTPRVQGDGLAVKVFTKICMADVRSTRHKRQLEPTTFPVAATLHHDYYTDYPLVN